MYQLKIQIMFYIKELTNKMNLKVVMPFPSEDNIREWDFEETGRKI